MGNAEGAIAEFRNHNPDAVSHIKQLRDSDTSNIASHSSHSSLPTSSSFMTNHGENIVLEEGEVIKARQDKQAILLPIPPHTTPPIPTIPLFSISERIEGDGPRQEAIMAALMQIRNTMFDYTFSENAADIDRVMVLGCQLVAETSPGEDHTNSIILELSCIWPPGTCCYDKYHFLFTFTLFITCTFIVGHMTDTLLFSHMTHYESLLGSMTRNS